jgi:hypothetical protein
MIHRRTSGESSRVDEDPFEKQMRLTYEVHVRASTTQRYDKPQGLDQLEEWIKENPIPYISHDNFSQEDIVHYWGGRLSGHTHVNQTYPDVVRMWRQFHGCPASGRGINRVFFAAGKQHDALKKKTMDKTLENTLKASINTMLSTCDDKGVSPMMMTHTGNTSSLRWQEVCRTETGGRGGGCDMDLLSGCSLDSLICE